MRNVRYTNRKLAVTTHAVERFGTRAGATYMAPDEIRMLIAGAVLRALDRGCAEAHYVGGQQRVRISLLGIEVYAIVGKDRTGWSSSGRAVVSVLTPEQIAESEGRQHPAMLARPVLTLLQAKRLQRLIPKVRKEG